MELEDREEILSTMFEAASQVLHAVDDGDLASSAILGILQSQSFKDALRAGGEAAFRSMHLKHSWSQKRVDELETLNITLQSQVQDLENQNKMALSQIAEAALETDALYLEIGRQRRLLAESIARASAESLEVHRKHSTEINAMQSHIREYEMQIRHQCIGANATCNLGVDVQQEVVPKYVDNIQQLKDEIVMADEKAQNLSFALAEAHTQISDLHILNTKMLQQQEGCRFCRDRHTREANRPAFNTGHTDWDKENRRYDTRAVLAVTGHGLRYSDRPRTADVTFHHNRPADDVRVASKHARPFTATAEMNHRQQNRLHNRQQLQQQRQQDSTQEHGQPGVVGSSWNEEDTSYDSSKDATLDLAQRCASVCSTSASTRLGLSNAASPDINWPLSPLPLSPRIDESKPIVPVRIESSATQAMCDQHVAKKSAAMDWAGNLREDATLPQLFDLPPAEQLHLENVKVDQGNLRGDATLPQLCELSPPEQHHLENIKVDQGENDAPKHRRSWSKRKSNSVTFDSSAHGSSSASSGDEDDSEICGVLSLSIRHLSKESRRFSKMLTKHVTRENIEDQYLSFEKHLSGIQAAHDELTKQPSQLKIAKQRVNNLKDEIAQKRVAHDKHVFESRYRPAPPDDPPPQLQSERSYGGSYKRWWIPCAPEKQLAVISQTRPRGRDSVDSLYSCQ